MTDGKVEREFVRGDVVRLAGGSPRLTVTEVIPERGPGSVTLCRCMWFEAGKANETLICAAALKLDPVTEAL